MDDNIILVNSLSGGETSSYLALEYPVDHNIFSLICIEDRECTPRDKKLVQMVNDKLEKYGFAQKYGEFIATAEDDKILKVMFDLEQMLGSEIVWVRHQSFEWWIDKKQMLPNMNMRYCTTEMKIIPICEWVVQNVRYPVLMNQGIRADESDRMKTGENIEYRNKIITGRSKTGNQNKWTKYFWALGNYPLVQDRVHHRVIKDFWLDKGIDFPKDSNCVGCFWKDVQQLRKNWDEQPKKMEWFSKQEVRKNHFFKPNIDYEQIKLVNIQQEFNFGTGSGCQAGFCTD